MKKTFFAFAFFLLCAVAGSQDTVVVYLDEKFSISLKELATYRREAVVVNNVIAVTDTRLDGTMVNYCEYKSLNPRVEHGKAVHYYEDGKIYSTGDYRFGQIFGKWIYYSPEGLADTVYYNYYDGKGDDELKKKAVNLNIANQRTQEASVGLKDSINAFVKAGFHMPARARMEKKENVWIDLLFIVDSEGYLRSQEIIQSAHPDIDREILRLLRLFHYEWEIKKPIVIPFMSFSFHLSPDDILSDAPVVTAEEMPMFPGGDMALMQFIYNNIQYPVDAKENNIQGKVIVRFVVTSTGGIADIQISKSVCPSIDAECIRLIKMLPPFVPGKSDGKPVNVWYTLPVTFMLR